LTMVNMQVSFDCANLYTFHIVALFVFCVSYFDACAKGKSSWCYQFLLLLHVLHVGEHDRGMPAHVPHGYTHGVCIAAARYGTYKSCALFEVAPCALVCLTRTSYLIGSAYNVAREKGASKREKGTEKERGSTKNACPHWFALPRGAHSGRFSLL